MLLVAMPLCIAAVALLAWGLAGLPLSAGIRPSKKNETQL
jgi:hypothetical protein